ncbi:MAG: efflux transporter outer membrane subunit [Sphingomonas sp.]|nr:efflux transporter outer membrane subunit [Sphingomonas sp.]
MKRLALAALLLAGACTPGPKPNLAVDQPPPRGGETIAPASGAAQALVAGSLVERGWWKRFGSPELDALVDQALAANNDLAAAQAALKQARALARAVKGDLGPQVDAGYTVDRSRVSNRISSPLIDVTENDYTLSTATLSVSYPVDLFGLGRNQLRSARARARAAAFQLDAARTTVVSNLVVAVITQAALDAQYQAAQASVTNNREILRLIEARQRLGELGQADVAQQATALAAAEATLPPLERARQHQRALILTLIGKAAGNALPPLPSLDALTLPDRVPLALPGEIVAHRPDVRAAQAAVEGAANDVGAAIAARLPQLTINGSFGGASEKIGSLFSSGNLFFSVVGGISAPIFHSGALKARQRAAEAALEVAQAQYRAAALQAYLDVDDALAGLRTDAAALDAAARARGAAAQSLDFTRRQARLGQVSTLALLSASAADAQAAQALVQAKAARLSDTVALYQATGTDSLPEARP